MDEQRNVAQQPEIPAGCLITRCLVDEASLKRGFRLALRGFIAFYVGIGIVFLLFWLAAVAMFGFGSVSIWVVFASGVLEIILGCSLPSRNARIQVRRKLETRGVESYEETTYCTPEALLFRSSYSQDVYRFRYEDIKFIRRDRDLIIVQSKGKQFEMLDAGRFENGTEADFWKLIIQKRPELKLPKGAL